MLLLAGLAHGDGDLAVERDAFERAWKAASRGQRAEFERLGSGLGDYVLYPYLRYEHYRHERGSVPAAEMADFLNAHRDWAFTAGLETAWLRTLGERGRWRDLQRHSANSDDAEVRCHRARARLELGLTEGLEAEVQDLWAVGHSQKDACDPVFAWLRSEGGITADLAWLRVRRAMESRNPRLTLYLTRFVPVNERIWVERWQQQDRTGYTRLDQARNWSDGAKARDITAYGLARLARRDPDRAWYLFERLDGRIEWGANRRGELMAELALWSAVSNAPDTAKRMRAVPEAARSDRVLEWWARNGLATGTWADVVLSVAAMSDETRSSERWRYWDARARLQLGDPDYANELLEGLARSASYYGFLAADLLDRPYAICPHQAGVEPQALAAFSLEPVVRRIIELDAVGLENWSRAEWGLMTRGATPRQLRLAAALATREDWPDRAIAALAASGDRQWYDWRFPVAYAPLVEQHAQPRRLDVSWVLGLMRSESAMAEDAVSPAGARGLMQVMPGTASRIARRHASLTWHGSAQLMRAEDNIVYGTTFLRELMDRFGDNPVLVSGAYNAGPGAVKRWLEDLPGDDPTVWVEILPFYETRDYIPRVLAFATIYDWRRQQPVQRLASRMPALDSGTMGPIVDAEGVADVACPAPSVSIVPGS
ncbi:transglycosylase SLT domain-containing protein [Elongatibacter sediminis]|uniref:Transglycosylase SLT domain-containing protein n=1 Tax=Elongatibacter sediminis TaxID=3119006 RepID=A0AAW9RKL4_9GAMM